MEETDKGRKKRRTIKRKLRSKNKTWLTRKNDKVSENLKALDRKGFKRLRRIKKKQKKHRWDRKYDPSE